MDINKSIQLAFQHYEAGDFQQAKHVCAEILKERPNSEEVVYLLGIVYAQLEEYDLAIQHIEKSLQLNISNADAYLALGAVYQKRGLLDEAVNFYKKAVEIDPNFAEAYENLGDIFRNNQKLDEAVTYYKKAIQYIPDSAEIYCNLGNIFMEKRQLDLAAFYYRKAIRYKSDCADAYKNLGIIFHGQKRLDEAISYYQKALQFDPNLCGACINLKDACSEKRRLDEAVNSSRERLGFSIRIGFMKVEMMINAVINQFYFKTLNVQFYPDVLYDEDYNSGLKRRILEKIFNEIKFRGVDKFFGDLNRLNAIKKYYEDRLSKAGPLPGGNNAFADHKKSRGPASLERLSREFALAAANVEARLAEVFDSVCRIEKVE
jgi:Tfp pilus assembly protein PilF